MIDSNMIPKEIDMHYQLYSKEPWEVRFGEDCSLCRTKIDEYGLCACGTIGGG